MRCSPGRLSRIDSNTIIDTAQSDDTTPSTPPTAGGNREH